MEVMVNESAFTRVDSLMILPSEGLFVHLHKIRNFLRRMRCMFSRETPARDRCINLFIFWIFQLQLFYQIGYNGIYMWNAMRNHDSDPTSMCMATVVMNWILQSIISVFYLRSWQRNSRLKQFLYLLYNSQNFAGCKEKIKVLNRVLFGMFVLIVVINLHVIGYRLMVIYVLTPTQFDLHFQAIFYYKPLCIIAHFVAMYNITLWIVVLALFVLCTKAAHIEFEHFNNRVRNIGKHGSKPINQDLLELVQVHRKLAKAVRCLDSLFEKYAFIMLATNIPTTIFSILLIGSSANYTLNGLAVALPSFAVCIIQLMGLTATPASLYKATCMSKEYLFSNEAVWQPYRQETYQIATYLLSHLGQSDLGVSIWGFAVVTKPLILTTLSAMVTLLALLLELKRKN
ncbi:hypothetical protein L596_013461 [Steinernema carpocapsae]|uniref:Odorant receptor n=1 Tax=Steinernema carpocapsae TaxID=34508 RepID=A0A4U5P0Q4_STECR|nr:hypothetical protein L596_013461 [Steinernema carpocapsae]